MMRENLLWRSITWITNLEIHFCIHVVDLKQFGFSENQQIMGLELSKEEKSCFGTITYTNIQRKLF